jgi:predicted amino acid-binding ACT domain protein
MSAAQLTPGSAPQVAQERRHRQNQTFLMLITMVLVVGFIALGNYLQWWTIGGRRAAAASVLCPEQKVSDPESTRINVYNGTDRHGLAAAVSSELQRRKFQVLEIDNKKQDAPLDLVAVIRFGRSGVVEAHTVSLQFPPTVELMQDGREDDSIDVILGDKYTGMIGRKEGARAIVPAAEPEGCVSSSP